MLFFNNTTEAISLFYYKHLQFHCSILFYITELRVCLGTEVNIFKVNGMIENCCFLENSHFMSVTNAYLMVQYIIDCMYDTKLFDILIFTYILLGSGHEMGCQR